MEPLVVVGTGLAGYTLAREWRRLVSDRPLVMVTRDGGEFYSKPNLSGALAAGRAPDAIPTATAPDMEDQLGARVHTRASITALDPARRLLATDGEEFRYHRVVLALGADPIRLPLEGNAADSVLSVNDLDDYRRFREALGRVRTVLILGAGLIGCEFANDLAGAGYAVHVADLASVPLARLLPEEAGAALRDALAGAGISWHLGDPVRAVNSRGGALEATFASGETVAADLALSAVGLRPRVALARDAGLAVGRGILADRHLTATDPNVSALGDCAEVEGLLLPYVMPIMHAARALARTLAGQPTALSYPAMPVVVKTPAWPTVVAPPMGEPEGEWEVHRTPQGLRGLFRDRTGRLLGFVLSGDAVKERQALARDIPPWLP